jgi:hypothetical protein
MNIDELQKELDQLLTMRAAAHEKHMSRYRDGSATRARTTTHSSNVGRINDRIVWLREEIKAATKRSCDDGYPSCRVAEATGRWCQDACAATAKQTR